VLPTANRPLAGVLDGMLTEQLAKLTKDDVVSRCKAQFLEQLASGEPSAEDIAQRLNMSSRTLQRKLAEANTTYLKLVDDCRRDLALRYITDPDKSITDITFLLGFSSQSAFSRAFRRWTGSSPTEDPVHPTELLATIYHAFGIDPETIVYNHLKQPRELVKAKAVTKLFA
jgi:AraC-like DNA-binding protein